MSKFRNATRNSTAGVKRKERVSSFTAANLPDYVDTLLGRLDWEGDYPKINVENARLIYPTIGTEYPFGGRHDSAVSSKSSKSYLRSPDLVRRYSDRPELPTGSRYPLGYYVTKTNHRGKNGLRNGLEEEGSIPGEFRVRPQPIRMVGPLSVACPIEDFPIWKMLTDWFGDDWVTDMKMFFASTMFNLDPETTDEELVHLVKEFEVIYRNYGVHPLLYAHVRIIKECKSDPTLTLIEAQEEFIVTTNFCTQDEGKINEFAEDLEVMGKKAGYTEETLGDALASILTITSRYEYEMKNYEPNSPFGSLAHDLVISSTAAPGITEKGPTYQRPHSHTHLTKRILRAAMSSVARPWGCWLWQEFANDRKQYMVPVTKKDGSPGAIYINVKKSYVEEKSNKYGNKSVYGFAEGVRYQGLTEEEYKKKQKEYEEELERENEEEQPRQKKRKTSKKKGTTKLLP